MTQQLLLQLELPPDHRIFHHSLLERMHPTIDWGENEQHEENSEKDPTTNDDVE